jgi:hypothetical protein
VRATLKDAKKWCKARVWDSGDMDSCGKKVYASGLCESHFEHHVLELRQHRKELIDELHSVDKRLEQIERLGDRWRMFLDV